MSDQPFSEDDFDALKERESLIFDLTESPGWQAITEAASINIEAQRRSLFSGRLSPEDYLRVTSWLQGADFILSLPEQIHGLVSELRRQIAEREIQET